jgi:hypothetical protein
MGQRGRLGQRREARRLCFVRRVVRDDDAGGGAYAN